MWLQKHQNIIHESAQSGKIEIGEQTNICRVYSDGQQT